MHKYTLNKKSKKLTRNAHFYANGELLKKMNSNSSEAAKEAFSASNLGGSIGSIGGAIGTITEAALANAEVDTSKADTAIEAVNNYQPATQSLDAIADSYNTVNFASTDWSGKDFSVSTGKALANMGKAGLSGAAAGAQVGGVWGAVGGLAAGLGAAGAGWAVGSSKAKARAEELNREARLANLSASTRTEAAIDTVKENEYNLLMRNMAADGGFLDHQHGGIFSNGIISVNNGGTHEQNPLEGVQMGIDREGIPNLVEEGEVIWNDYVFSNRLKLSKEFKKRYKIKSDTFAKAAKEVQKESEERPNDPISKNGLEDSMIKLIEEQELIRQFKDLEGNSFKCGGMKKNKYDSGSWLRYAPVIGSGLSVLSDAFGLTNKPDYSNPNLIREAANNVRDVNFTPITEKLTYSPFDTQFYSAKLADQNAATKKAIQNTSQTQGAAVTGLLLSDYNSQGRMGELFRQAEEYNQAQKERVSGFNRQTEAMNSEMAMKRDMANQQGDELRLRAAMTEAQMRESIDSTANAARSANLTGLFDNLGAAGKEKFAMDMIEKNPALLYTFMGDYKGGNTKACGGKISRKRRK